MNTMKGWPGAIVVISAFLILGSSASASTSNQPLPTVPFIKNEGLFDAKVAYYAKLFSGDLYITKQGQMVYTLPQKGQAIGAHSIHRAFITEALMDVNSVKPLTNEASVTRVSYIRGNDQRKWKINQSTFDSIFMPQVWDNIDLELKAYQQNIEKLFTLQPGADVSDIRLKISGANDIEINPSGALLVSTDLGIVSFTPPVAWQTIDGRKEAVNVHYQLNKGYAETYGFVVDEYDTDHALIIDPLIQSTFLGGSGSDNAEVIAIASNGDVYVAGQTWLSYGASNDFPGLDGGVDVIPSSEEIFVSRLSSDLTTLYQTTYLGGGQSDRIHDLAIAANGDIILVGETYSNDFPGVTGGLDEILSGAWDGFVTRLTPALTGLVQSTYLGGGQDDGAWAVLIESDGHIMVAGVSRSADFPGVAGGAYTVPANADIFLSRLNSNLQAVSQSTFYGGTGFERPYALELGGNGDFYLAGFTDSADLNDVFGGALTTHAGYIDGFIVQMASDLKTVKQATYLGGAAKPDTSMAGTVVLGSTSPETVIRAMIIADNGDVYVGGDTNSDQIPGTSGGAISSYRRGYLSQLGADLTEFKQSTYVGGTNLGGEVSGLTFDDGDLLATGSAGDGVGFPAISGGDDTSSSNDAYLMSVASNLKSFKQSTFIGGSQGYESGNDLVVAPGGMIYVTGKTSSKDFNEIDGGADTTFVDPDQSESFISMFDSLTGSGSSTEECTFFILKGENGRTSVICL